MWVHSLAACLVLFAMEVRSALITTTHGPIEGKEITIFNGKKVDAFLGVPYADPPTGLNRFSPTQPLTPWNKTLQAKELPIACPQVATEEMFKTDWYVLDVPFSEDCLYLNVWIPQGVTEKMPVMIWIPGGGFITGSSAMAMYDGKILAAEHQVIVASLNYRTGMFGFLCLNDSSVPGNAGLQDQIQAIKWIRDNVDAFGGDRDRITLFGQSAGGFSVSNHLANKDVRPLFRNAILESGTTNNPAATMSVSQGLQTSLDMAKKAGCPMEETQELLSCLRKVDTKALAKITPGLFVDGHITYCPVRNGIEVPVDISKVGSNVPPGERKNLLSGIVPREVEFILTDFFPQKYLTDDLVLTYEDMVTAARLVLQLKDERLVSVLFHEYKSFDGTFNASQLRLEILTALSDYVFLCSQVEFSKQWQTESNDIYFYYFNHRPSKPLRFTIPEWGGTIHGDEIPLVFGLPLDPSNGYSDEDKDMSVMLSTYWTNFAKTGNPNSGDSTQPEWPKLPESGNFTHVEFNNGAEVKSYLRGKECDFWRNVHPQLVSIQKQLDQSTTTA